MGLFDFRKKNKEQDAEDVNRQEAVSEEAVKAPKENPSEGDRWNQAHQASPQAYQNSDGSPFLVFTMTEDTDTILPMDPRQMYKAKGKEIRDIRLGLVSLSEDRVIGDLPFYFCSKTLADNMVESRPPFFLVRGMSLQEMNDLIKEVEAEVESRAKMQELFAENLEFLSRDEITKETVDLAFAGERIETHTFEDVSFPTGELIAADPVANLQDPDTTSYLRETIPAGKYPLTLGILRSEDDTVRITGMRLKVRAEEAVSYTFAEDYRVVDDEGTEEQGYMGFSVESGMATFCDGQAAENYWDFLDEWEEENPDGDFSEDCLEEGDHNRFPVPGSDDEIIMAASGFGDGFYSAFWGKNAVGDIVELVSVFIDPALYERM